MSTEKARSRKRDGKAFTRINCPVTETSDISVFDFNEEDQFSAGIRKSSRKTRSAFFLGFFKPAEKQSKGRSASKRKQSAVKRRSIAALSGEPSPRVARRWKKQPGRLRAKGPLSFECKQRAASLDAPAEPCRSKNTCANSLCEHGDLGKFVEELPIGGEVASRTNSGHHAGENIAGLLPEGEAGLFVSSDSSLNWAPSNVGSCLKSSPDSSHDKHVSPAEKQTEVVIIAEELLLWGDSCVHSPRFTFATDFIKIEILADPRSDADWKIFQWPLDQINGFRSCSNQDAGFALLELGVSAGLQSLKRCIGMSSTSNEDGGQLLLRLNYNYWLEQQRQITALCDHYKTLWRPLQEDELHTGMAELFGRFEGEPRPVFLNNNGCMRSGIRWFDIVYPKEDPDAVTVTSNDFQLLNPEEFVSDTIIDFYIKHLQSSLSGKQRGRFYFFNSFFFRKLTEHENQFLSGLEKSKIAFEGVKRWTAKTNLFEKDFIFVPIMQSAHWSLIIICYPGPISEDDDENRGSKKSCILHLDSLEGCHVGLEEPIRNYLLEAWIQKYGYDEDVSGCKRFSEMEFVSARVPQQTNYYDCGLFLLHYVELFIKQAEQEGFPDFLTSQWFNPSQASSKRFYLQNLIIELLKESAGNTIYQEACGLEEGMALFESNPMCCTDDNPIIQEPTAHENNNWVEKVTSDGDFLLTDPQSSDLRPNDLETLVMKPQDGNLPLILMECSDQVVLDPNDREIIEQGYQLPACDKCAVPSCNVVHTFYSFAGSKSCLPSLQRHLQPLQTDIQLADNEHMEVCKSSQNGPIEAPCGVQLTNQQCHPCVPSTCKGYIKQVEPLPCTSRETTWKSSEYADSDDELLPSELTPDKAVCVNIIADCNRSYFMNNHGCHVHSPVCRGERLLHVSVGGQNEFIACSDHCSDQLMTGPDSQIKGHAQESSVNEGCINGRCMYQLKLSDLECNGLGSPVISIIRERCMEGIEKNSDADRLGSSSSFRKGSDGTKGIGANSESFPVENGCTESALGNEGSNEETNVQRDCEEERAKSCEYFHGGIQTDEIKDVLQISVATNRHSCLQEEEKILYDNTSGKDETDPNLCKIPNLADPYYISDDDDDDVSQRYNRTRQLQDVEHMLIDVTLKHKRKKNVSSCGTQSPQVTATRPLTRSAVKKLEEKTQKSDLSGYVSRRKRLLVDLH